MTEKYLPIGSVCRLKGGQKNVMIIGFMPSAAENNNKVCDYLGALYPEGVFFSSDMNFMFDHDQIEEVLFNGYVTDEEVMFKKRLVEFVNYGTIDGEPVNIDQSNIPNNIPNNQNINQQPNYSQPAVQPQMFSNNEN